MYLLGILNNHFDYLHLNFHIICDTFSIYYYSINKKKPIQHKPMQLHYFYFSKRSFPVKDYAHEKGIITLLLLSSCVKQS
jgi:hypothetical protein